jgi:Spy/CpxP family protein refolding chaperone
MKSWSATARGALGMLAIVAMVPATGFAFGGHRNCETWKGPPQEAIQACTDLNAGDVVQFKASGGETVSGVCREIGGRLVAVPGRGPEGRMGMGHGKGFARMAKKLDLTEAQQKQVQVILASAREQDAPLRQQLAESREKIRKAVETDPFDEVSVRTLAESQNKLRVDLTVSRARVEARIYALLTPEQREAARKLRPWGEGRHEHRHWR